MSHYTYDPNQFNQQTPTQFVAGQGQDMSNLLVYQIKGKPAFAYCDIMVQPNQRIVTDGDVMLWMDAGLDEPDTVCWGGCCKSMCRALSGEKFCFNTFQNKSDKARKVTVGQNDPGDMLAFGVTPGNGWVLNDDAFIAGTDGLDIGARFVGCCAACWSSENLFLTKVTCKKDAEGGVFIGGGYGALVRHDIPAGQCLFVARSLFFAAHETTRIRMGIAGSLNTFCCTWAAIVMKFYGPSVVYTQSRDPKLWNPYKNNKKNKSQHDKTRS